MHHRNVRKIALSLGLLLAAAGIALAVQQVWARSHAASVEQVSPLHPSFALLDAEGENVLQTSQPVSTMQTCGQCHDTAYIAEHSFHADLGWSEQTQAGETATRRAWDISTGLYGKWNPLTYRYLGVEDLSQVEWVKFNAARLVGGGPAEQATGLEMNCFLCHFSQPDHTSSTAAIQAGDFSWANTATLLASGVVSQDGDGYTWNPAAFDDQGLLSEQYVTIQDPTNQNCAACHGVVHTDLEQPLTIIGCAVDAWQTATTGQVISPQRISLSGTNLQDKAQAARSYDIHAERGLKCTNCHFSLNNPIYALKEESSPDHLQFDPRRLEIGEYLQRPDHNFARGQSAQTNLAPELKGTMRRCESCHNADGHADWLPYVDRHMEELACESCHIPKLYAPAVQSYDWTVLTLAGEPAQTCRGKEGADPTQPATLQNLVTGFEPVLLQRKNIDGDVLLAPYNLVSAWYWIVDSPSGTIPVLQEDLKAAWFEGNHYAPDVLAVLDMDSDGILSSTELRLDTAEKQALIASRLAALGLQNPRIQGEIQPYSVNHNVTRGEWVSQDCQSCHSDNSRLAQPLKLADYLPGGVQPEFVQDANTLISNPAGSLSQQEGALYYRLDTSAQGLYIFGHNRVSWIDWLGALAFVGVLAGVSAHGGLRFLSALKLRKQGAARHAAPTRKVYMYAVYERFWHWLQTFTIVLLIFTGLIIHRPDIFGLFSFRYMVSLHNVLAAVLVINAGLSLFYHLAGGEIRQFIPRPYGFFDQAIVQAKFYLQGIFKGDPHPFEKTPDKKLNPLQQATYFGILNVLLPLQILTGALMWGVQQFPQIAAMLGGLPFLAPFHSLVAWLFAAFIVAHVYLTTTGHEPLESIRAMLVGWETVEDHQAMVELDEQPSEGGS